ncbi:sterol 26-hydroxylase, mitochondrial [Gopherus evgoodei]|uniref:sterol 26-hydroxylase, mitochondrial n=1 Tax=Gopherus evgoodei TaxID=1825980 RepID=UPI0011CF92F1|nr:sterol 26-hydroxylase, mitochondrial [Gopherus evgoodei]
MAGLGGGRSAAGLALRRWLQPLAGASRSEPARQGRASAAGAAAAVPGEQQLKGPEELPGPGLLRSLYWGFVRGYLLHTHQLQVMFRKDYGPMWKSTFGKYKNVNIGSPELLEQLLRQEGKYPMRSDMALWKEHRDTRQLPYGPLTEEGERWYRLRQVLNQRMLKPSEAMLYAGAINEVVSDLMARLQAERVGSPSGVLVEDVANLLYRFALEGISYILFETRTGCLEREIPAETRRFIDAIGLMLKNSVYATVMPQWSRKLLPFWRRYLENWDTIFAFGKKLIDRKMEELEGHLERGEQVSGYLSYLLASGRLTPEEVYGSVAELLMAGVDTTSNTLSWALYHLARAPEIQISLYQEVNSVVPRERIPSAKDLAKMPLLRAIIKETLRLYPVVPTNARVIVENDVVIGGYHFPKNTLFVLAHYAMAHDQSSFPEPERFLPQRWLRGHGSAHHPFSSIPFGYGVRGCLGRRIAELEMHLALARIARTFELRPDPQGTEVTSVSRIVLVPNKPINLQFIARQPGP